MADTTYQPKVYRKQGGEEMVIASGKFHVTAFLTQSGGSEVTPFSATVS